MSADIKDHQVKIPNELVQFLGKETYSLLVKGHTGTGKTTLALSILREMNMHKNCLYISTRISPTQLFQFHPWIGKFFNQPENIELAEISEDRVDHPIFVDARLDEPALLFERITNELMDVKAPIIIIDTWDAIGFFMDKEALVNNIKVLQTWRERARAKLIFVTEVPEDKAFDFLVDGIVELKERNYNERRVREIFLSKLRGIRINRPSYIFSVNDGLFHSYDHYRPSEFADSTLFSLHKNITESDLFKNKSHFTTGYRELDELLGGGFPIGSTIGIDLDSHVNAKIAFAFLSRVLANFIASKNPLIFQPLEKTGSELITQYQKSLGSQKDLINLVLPKSRSKQTRTNATKTIDKQLEDIKLAMQNIKKKHPKKYLLSILGPDASNLFSKADSDSNLHGLLSFIKSNSALSIFVSRRLPGSKQSHLSSISDIILYILEIDGTMFLQSDRPWSHLFAIVAQSEKSRGIKLDPIV